MNPLLVAAAIAFVVGILAVLSGPGWFDVGAIALTVALFCGAFALVQRSADGYKDRCRAAGGVPVSSGAYARNCSDNHGGFIDLGADRWTLRP